MLHPVFNLGALGVVEAVESAHQVTGDAADTLEGNVIFLAAAAGTLVTDQAVEAADQKVQPTITFAILFARLLLPMMVL